MLGINEDTMTKKELQVINHAIIIGKMCISKYKYGKNYHLVSLYRSESRLRKLDIVFEN